MTMNDANYHYLLLSSLKLLSENYKNAQFRFGLVCFNETVKQWTDAYTHDWRGFNETRQKNLFKSGLLEIDTLNSVDTFS